MLNHITRKLPKVVLISLASPSEHSLMKHVSVPGLYLFKSINLRNSEVKSISGAPVSTAGMACMLFSVLCTSSRDRFLLKFIRREEVEAWLS